MNKKKLITFIVVFSIVMLILLIICGILFKSTLYKFNESYLMRNFLDDNVDLRDIEKIVIKNNKDVPKNAEKVWDVSEKHNNSIIAWITDIDNNGLYELYIGTKGKVKANPNSSYIFSACESIELLYLNKVKFNNHINVENMFNEFSSDSTIYVSDENAKDIINVALIGNSYRPNIVIK